jgi:hypothetical protein
MAAKAFGTAGGKTAQATRGVDEIFFQNEAVSLCLLVNRRAKTMRIVDFRAGPSDAKRLFVLTLARREGVEKAFTLVERDEVQTWTKLGFAKEANIPGFYKRSDAFLLGCPVPPPGSERAQSPASGEDEAVLNSEIRLAVAEPVAGQPAPLSPAHQRMERTIVLAKRAAKEQAARSLPPAKILAATEADARKAVAAAVKAGRALTAFEPFGRDVVRSYFSATARGGFSLSMSTESQACFGNAFLELVQSPRSDAERVGTAAAVKAMCDKLQAEGVVSCFSLAPSDDVGLAIVFVQNGFRRTGLLLDHMLVGGERKDAIVWSRKLSNPGEE